MAGGCCCIVKRKDSAIIGFAAMNIAIFALLFVICCIQFTYCGRSQLIHHFELCTMVMFSIFFCLVGVIAGILLLFAVTSHLIPLILFLCTFPFFIWSAIAVGMSCNGIVSGTVGDEQQGQMYGQIYNQPPSNQQMLPPNQNGGYPTQPQYGNNAVWPQLYQMPPPPGP